MNPSLHSLIIALHRSWGVDTAQEFDPTNPPKGQCAVTALIVQDEFGGDLLRCATPDGSHYWNRLPDGTEIDLTAGQFPEPVERTQIIVRDRSYLTGSPDTNQRYRTLKGRVNECLG